MIRGTIDQRDLNVWLNWRCHQLPEKKRPWWTYWIGPGLFVFPFVVSELAGFDFHVPTYLVTVACWSIFLALFLFYKFLSRRKKNRCVQPYDISIERSGDTVFFQGAESRFDCPAKSLATIRLAENLLIFRDGAPISISPRNENLEDEKTLGDIEKLISAV